MRPGRLYRADSLCKVCGSEPEPLTIEAKIEINESPSSRPSNRRRGYLRPALREFGAVGVLTQAGTAVPVEMSRTVMGVVVCNNNQNANRC